MKPKYAYWDTLVLPITKVVKSTKLFSELELEGISGVVTLMTAHIFDTELEAVRFGLGRAQDRVWTFGSRIKELEAAA